MKQRKPRLVQETAARLRNIILQRDEGAHIGSLKEVAGLLDVGIVTVQQAARILEHEGFLAVRRGPGGGYYGTRPDETAVERAFSAYLRVHSFGYREATEMLALFDCEIIPAAAACGDAAFRSRIEALLARLDQCATRDDRLGFEESLRDLLFQVVKRPLIELMSRVTSQTSRVHPKPSLFSTPEDVAVWKAGRQRILLAILARDDELARFEAERHRREVLRRIHREGAGPEHAQSQPEPRY